MNVHVHDSTRCLLGEGALWHPEREQLFWCDILSNRVVSRVGGALYDWTFNRHVSCLGWVDRDTLLVATADDLTLLDLETGARRTLCELEADRPGNRSNDGRADPQGGFWVSTMSIAKEKGAGGIYRWYRGELRKLRSEMSIPNSICFAPDHKWAYLADTHEQKILRWRLGADGWPEGEPEVLIDFSDSEVRPDGSVCDMEGNIWNAQWGNSRIACYGSDGTFRSEIPLPAKQATCPAFGGPNLDALYCTSAAVGLTEEELTHADGHGRTFVIDDVGAGQAEHRVIV